MKSLSELIEDGHDELQEQINGLNNEVLVLEIVVVILVFVAVIKW